MYSFILGHVLNLKAIYGDKVRNHKLESENLTLLLRRGNLKTAG